MNILYINHYAGSKYHGMEFRPYYLGIEWRKKGNLVVIVAGSESHVRKKSPKMKRHLQVEVIDDLYYYWIRTPHYNGNGFARAINIFSFVIQLIFYKKLLINQIKPDVVIASSTYPLDIIPAYLISRKSNAKLIFEVHDLWPLSPIELGGMSPKNPFIILMQFAENFAYKNADLVVSILPKTIDHMVEHGLDSKKFYYIPNGINSKEWDNHNTPLRNHLNSIIMELKKKQKFLIGYAGSHGIANSLGIIIKAADFLRNENISFVLVGDGPEKTKLVELTKIKKLDNVIFFDSISRDEIPDFLGNMDVLFIGLKNEPLFRFGVNPNKLIDYMMAGKPIIYAINSGNNMVNESKCGISIKPENPEELSKAILDLRNLSEKERNELGENGKSFILANNNYDVLGQKFLDLFMT